MIRTNSNAYHAFAITAGEALERPASGGLWVIATGDLDLVVGGMAISLTGVAANVHIPFVVDAVGEDSTAEVVGLY